ncbi:MAG TPA: adenylate/guanylate cyclase domain-containing protein [Methylophilaceae bacterium]|nr:adenylate/guanylate cyclase domain-containing protein [Methylophilaceae bacterium]
MSERLNKTSICSVVFLDIVNQSKKPVAEQIRDKELFNGFINEAVKDVAQNDRILLDTGDGAAIALLGAPEEALFIAMTIRDSILKYNKDNKHKLYVRTGINLGPVRVVSDINGRPNILGDGINVAERVMSFTEPNQILVSRSYYEITSRLTEEITGMFTYFGIKQDKHIREHEVYSIRSAEEEPLIPESAVKPAAAASPTFFSRLLNNENLSRYGLWGSVALVTIAISAGAFMLISNMLSSDLIAVTADTSVMDPKTPALQTAAVSDSGMQPDAPGLKAVAPVMAKPGELPSANDGEAAKTSVKSETPKRKSITSGKKQESVQQVSQPLEESTVAIAPVQHKPVVEEGNDSSQGEQKSGWSAFKESLKKGREERVCSQAEIALNQCG